MVHVLRLMSSLELRNAPLESCSPCSRRDLSISIFTTRDLTIDRSPTPPPLAFLQPPRSRVIVYIREQARPARPAVMKSSKRTADNPRARSRLHASARISLIPLSLSFFLVPRAGRAATTAITAALTEIRHCFPRRGGTRRATMDDDDDDDDGNEGGRGRGMRPSGAGGRRRGAG